MNLTPDQAKARLEQNATALRHHNSNLSIAGSRKMACDIAPALVRAAGFSTPASVSEFANSAAPALTISERRAKFTAYIENERTRLGKNFDYNRAFNQFANSSDGAAMSGTAVTPQQFGQGQQSNPGPGKRTPENSGGPTPASSQCPTFFTAGMCSLLGLGRVDQNEAAAAWKSNGGTFSPLDHKQVFQGLVNYHSQTGDVTKETAAKRVREAHPNLAQNYNLVTAS